LHYRLTTADDLPTCREMLHPGLRIGQDARDRLVSLWTELLPRSTTFAVIEDPARPHPDSIEAFGASVFVTDAFAAAFSSGPRPYLSAIIYDEILSGRSPVLTRAQIRESNSSTGLNVAVLHFCLRNPDMSDARTQKALQAGSAAFYFCHAGYKLNAMLHEVYGAQHAGYMKTGGFRLLTDFDDGAFPEVANAPPAHRPFLFLLRREWMEPAAVSQLAFLFQAPRPQFGFSQTERHVLLRALLNEPDVQIAASLGVPLDTVKKVWRRAYERVAHVMPYLLHSTQPAGTHRGTEKRRHLLEYLRSHLEELRP
jgi:hypothetical protein